MPVRELFQVSICSEAPPDLAHTCCSVFLLVFLLVWFVSAEAEESGEAEAEDNKTEEDSKES